MKAIQVTFDETLLERLDRLPAVRQRGRSAVLREAATEYLRRLENEEIDRRYAMGYGSSGAIQSELQQWDEEGVWPED
jgi:metal-responsive CopG/Arc/MetJ family transcriptional regulator